MSARRTAIGGAVLAGLALAPEAARAAGEGGGGADLAWRVANLALLLGVLYAFARKPLRAWFSDRRDAIESELASAARMRSEAEERYASFQRRLADLDGETEGIRARARERAEAERESILAEARASAERIRKEARLAVEQELRRARQRLREEAADLSVELAAGLLRERVSERDRARLLDEFIDTIEHRDDAGTGS